MGFTSLSFTPISAGQSLMYLSISISSFTPISLCSDFNILSIKTWALPPKKHLQKNQLSSAPPRQLLQVGSLVVKVLLVQAKTHFPQP